MEAIAGIAFLGKLLSDNQKAEKNPPKKNKNRESLFDSQIERNSYRKLKKKAQKRLIKSRDPDGNIIPWFSNRQGAPRDMAILDDRYTKEKKIEHKKIEHFTSKKRKRINREKMKKQSQEMKHVISSESDSVFSDSDVVTLDNQTNVSIGDNPTSLFDKSNNLRNNKLHEMKFNTLNQTEVPGFFSQFEPLEYDNPEPEDPVSQNAPYKKRGRMANVSRLEEDRKLALQGAYSKFSPDEDMTYGVIDKDNMTTLNMTPYFSGKSYGDNSEMSKNLDMIKQRKVESFTGSLNDLNFRPKTERRPLFNPIVGLTNIYGQPSYTDYMETRYMPSRERRNEFLMQPERITPGLNLAYNEVSKSGFHDTYRALPKNVDALRAASNPKISYGRPVIQGMKGRKRRVFKEFAKRRPETFRENDPRDLTRALSYYRAPTAYGHFDAPMTMREITSQAHFGPAGNKQISKGHARDLKDIPDQTIREVTAATNRVGPAGNKQLSKGHARDLKDIPDFTLKDAHIHQNYVPIAGNKQFHKGHAFDLKDIPDDTLREVHINKNYVPGAGNKQFHKGHAFDLKDIPEDTLREVHINKDYVPRAGTTQFQKGHAFDFGDVPEMTLKDIHINKDHIGGAGNKQITKWRATDFNDVPEMTLKDVHINKNHVGGVGNKQFQKGHAFDLNDIPDPTLREAFSNQDWIGGAGNKQLQKWRATDFGDIPDPTLRDVHINKNHVGGAGNKQITKWRDIPEMTLKDVHINKDYIQGAGNKQITKWRATDFGDIPEMTLRDVHINKNHIGGAGNKQLQKWRAIL